MIARQMDISPFYKGGAAVFIGQGPLHVVFRSRDAVRSSGLEQQGLGTVAGIEIHRGPVK